MAATIATTMAMLNAKCISTTTSKSTQKVTTLLCMQNLPKGLKKTSKTSKNLTIPLLSGTALAGAIFSTLATSDAAFAAQQIAELAATATTEGSDNRGLALLLPIIPAIAWVLFNILQPALNQINKMRSKGVIVGVGLGGLAASEFLMNAPEASAAVEAAGNDNRGQLLLFVVAPAILWVLYNIFQPALNQINKMRS